MSIGRALCAMLLAAGMLGGCRGERREVDPRTGKPIEIRTLRVYCGGSMSKPMHVLVKEFEAAHPDVRINISYNGCGILVSQMKAAHDQDAFVGDVYYACDTSFMDDAESYAVVDSDYPVVRVTRFFPVILVKKGNPLSIRSVDDLAQPGVKLVAVGEEGSGAVGRTGWAILRASPQWERIRPKVKYESPTADMLVSAVATGDADAAIVWDVVARPSVADGKTEMVYVEGQAADQPIARLKGSRHPELAREFIEFVRSDHARQVFREHGFVIEQATTRAD